MIVRAANGVTLVQSSVPQTDVTNELTAYPPELLTAPLSVREADFTYRVGINRLQPHCRLPIPLPRRLR